MKIPEFIGILFVKNEEKGISAEIPLSQILGRPTYDCSLSRQHCAVYDGRGNVVLTLCKMIDFIIEKADRKTMTVVGKTNKTLIKNAENRENFGKQYNSKYYHSSAGYINNKIKEKRFQRIEEKKKHTIRNKQQEENYKN